MKHPSHSFAAWALVALLVAPLAQAGDIVEIRAVPGLPRTGTADGRAILWRNVGIAVESGSLEAEASFATCIPATTAPAIPSDRSASACAASTEPYVGGNMGHEFALTYKMPRWNETAPLIDVSLRGWRASSQAATSMERSDGTVAELVATQPFGNVDAFFGYSIPVARLQAASGWRSAFAGLTWYAGRDTRLDLIADRGVEESTLAKDRTITVRLVHATAAQAARIAAWTTHSLDERTDAWRFGAGFDIRF